MEDDGYQPDECSGACFSYVATPQLFGDRMGWGPMRVAWDTNVLIDYVTNLVLYRDGDVFEPPAGLDEEYAEELVALVAFMQIWMMRDIRIYVTGAQLSDGRLSRARRRARQDPLLEVAAALECLRHEPPGRLLDEIQAPTPGLPRGLTKADRHIVSESLRLRCHVLLTRDEDDILTRRNALMAFGLAALRPTEWLDAMVAPDELGIRGCIHGLVLPDTHKWQHLAQAQEGAAAHASQQHR